MKLVTKSSYGHPGIDRSRHTVTKYPNGKETQAAINSKLFKKLNNVNNSFYGFELSKAEIEHKKSKIVVFFILQNAKVWMLELHYNFFIKFCDVNMFKVMEMDTDYLYIDLAEKELEDYTWLEIKTEWERLRSKDRFDSFTADAVANSFPQKRCDEQTKPWQETAWSLQRRIQMHRDAIFM